MTARPRPQLPPSGLLDWRDSSHWSREAKPCRYCDRPTNLRDSRRSPAHKICAEAALQQQAADTADAYQNGQL
ncbi:hypothetical protein ACFWM0_14840 [Streptomyces sp. NPDC058405]|uniref:hypothetical protein n=1 Tax=Streptomyces sp. NPDC058405 TaxID=3346482 RepID=UPI0036477B85